MRKTLRQQQPYRQKISGDPLLLKLHPTIRHKGKMKYEPMYHTIVDNYVERRFKVGDTEVQLLTPDHAYLYQSIRRHSTEGDAFSVMEYAGRLGWSKTYFIHALDRLEDVGLLRREKIIGYPRGGAPMDYVSFDPLQNGRLDESIDAIVRRITVEWRTTPREGRVASIYRLSKFGVLRGYTAVMRYQMGRDWPEMRRNWSDIWAILNKKIAGQVHQIVTYLMNTQPDLSELEFRDQFTRHFIGTGFKENYLAERTAIEWRRKLQQGGLSNLDALAT